MSEAQKRAGLRDLNLGVLSIWMVFETKKECEETEEKRTGKDSGRKW